MERTTEIEGPWGVSEEAADAAVELFNEWEREGKR